MSADDVKLLGEKIDAMAARVTSLEEAVSALMLRSANHEKLIRWLRNVGLILLGVALGSGAVHIDEVAAILKTP